MSLRTTSRTSILIEERAKHNAYIALIVDSCDGIPAQLSDGREARVAWTLFAVALVAPSRVLNSSVYAEIYGQDVPVLNLFAQGFLRGLKSGGADTEAEATQGITEAIAEEEMLAETLTPGFVSGCSDSGEDERA